MSKLTDTSRTNSEGNSIDADDLIASLRVMQEHLKEREAKLPIPHDHVCVIHPRHRRMLEDMDRAAPMNNFMGFQPGMLGGFGGRKIFEESRAPQDRFEFMSLITYYHKYPPIFPPQYSRSYIIWDVINTTIRRWYMQLKWKMKRRK